MQLNVLLLLLLSFLAFPVETRGATMVMQFSTPLLPVLCVLWRHLRSPSPRRLSTVFFFEEDVAMSACLRCRSGTHVLFGSWLHCGLISTISLPTESSSFVLLHKYPAQCSLTSVIFRSMLQIPILSVTNLYMYT